MPFATKPYRVSYMICSAMKSILFTSLLGFFLIFSLAASLKYECPEPEDIFPCYCEEEDDDPVVFCNHLSKPEDIYKGVKGLKGHRIYKMSFFMNWILDPIKPDAFKDLAVERIFFENSTIKLTSPQFKGMDHLNSIQLRAIYNKTNPIIPLELDHLPKLREIIFEKNRVTMLPNDWLKSVPESVRSVSVEENTIVSMEDEVFSKIKRLTFLVLEGNRIVLIKRSMFPNPATDMRSLNLNNNRIKYLPHDIFSEMPSLRNLEITGNRLSTLEEMTWSDVVSQVTKLDLSENPLECDSSLKWLYTDVKTPAILLGRCHEPENLRGKALSQLTANDFN